MGSKRPPGGVGQRGTLRSWRFALWGPGSGARALRRSRSRSNGCSAVAATTWRRTSPIGRGSSRRGPLPSGVNDWLGDQFDDREAMIGAVPATVWTSPGQREAAHW